MDLPTLNSILLEFNITSNSSSKKFNLLYKTLTINSIIKIFENVFEQQIFEKIKELNKKHPSCLSRELLTHEGSGQAVVLDDSVFKAWLQNIEKEINFKEYFNCFFSGQYNSTVYGFKNACIGIVIDGIYFPLYFECVKKKKKSEKKELSTSIVTAKKLVSRFGKMVQRFKKKGVMLNNLKFSCDSGYSDLDLAKCCEENGLVYMSVPKQNHNFEINGKKIKLKECLSRHLGGQKQLI